MYRFIGNFEDLKELGFTHDISNTYWFKTKMDNGHTLFINVRDRSIEYSYKSDLDCIKNMIEEIE